MLALFGENRSNAKRRFVKFVSEGLNAASPWEQLKGQIYLGDEEFVKGLQTGMDRENEDINIPKPQRRSPPASLHELASTYSDRAIFAALLSGSAEGASIATQKEGGQTG